MDVNIFLKHFFQSNTNWDFTSKDWDFKQQTIGTSTNQNGDFDQQMWGFLVEIFHHLDMTFFMCV